MLMVSLANIASRYQTRLSAIVVPTTNPTRILLANPNRYSVCFPLPASGGTSIIIAPGPFPTGFTSVTSFLTGQLIKFSDGPSIVTGEWYTSATLAPYTVPVWECIYLE